MTFETTDASPAIPQEDQENKLVAQALDAFLEPVSVTEQEAALPSEMATVESLLGDRANVAATKSGWSGVPGLLEFDLDSELMELQSAFQREQNVSETGDQSAVGDGPKTGGDPPEEGGDDQVDGDEFDWEVIEKELVDKENRQQAAEERKSLLEKLSIPEKAGKQESEGSTLRDSLDKFERRLEESGYKNRHRIVRDTYKSLNRILQDDDKPFDASTRKDLVAGIVEQLKKPTVINQGLTNSCSAAAFESCLYTRRPDIVTRIVADLATTGMYSNGTVKVELDADSLVHNELSKGVLEILEITGAQVTSNRSHASQLFQVAAINLAMGLNDSPVSYVQRKASIDIGGIDYGDGFMKHEGDSAHPLTDVSGNPEKFHGVRYDQFVRLVETVSGSDAADELILKAKSAEGKEGLHIGSIDDLKKTLTELKQSNDLPRLAVVFAGNPPFSATGVGADSHHVVSIVDFDPATGSVHVDNQWDERLDYVENNQLTTETLYKAMCRPGISRLSDVARKLDEVSQKLATEGKYKPLLDYNRTLYRQASGGFENHSDYEEQLGETWARVIKHFQNSPDKQSDERIKSYSHFSLLLCNMSRESRLHVIDHAGKKSMEAAAEQETNSNRESTVLELSAAVLKHQIKNDDLKGVEKEFERILRNASSRWKKPEMAADRSATSEYLKTLAKVVGPAQSHAWTKSAHQLISKPTR